MTTRGIPCPICGPTRWEVVRTTAQVNRVRRERRCLTCGYRLDTEERVIPKSATGSNETTENCLLDNPNPNNESRGQNATRLAS